MWSADAPFLLACRGAAVPHTPVWFMRQAGRALPEYRARKGSTTILDALRDPALAAELTLQPVKRFGVDAAILYSDIVTPAHAIGFGIDIKAGVGPVAPDPFRTWDDLERLRPLVPEEDLPWQAETVRLLAAESPVPLIGFAGAPFTVASYLVEGGPSREQAVTRTMLRAEPDLWAALLDRLADLAIASLRSQVEAGAAAVQLFDSWAGSLSEADYRRSVLPASTKVFDALADLGVPRIHFGVGTGELLGAMADAGADVVGVDWRIPLATAVVRTGGRVSLQGNIDPTCLLGDEALADAAVDRVLADAAAAAAAGLRGWVANLGHGVMPQTDPDRLARVVERVHAAPPPVPGGA